MADIPPLVSCERLKALVESGSNDDFVILDVSWYPDKDASAEYKNEHIPGSQYMNVMGLHHTEYLKRNIPTKEEFQERARDMGINNGSRVIVYSDTDAKGFYLSGRAWWTFKMYGHDRVSIVDGGLSKWKSLGYPLTKHQPDKKEGNFTSKWNPSIYLSFDDMIKVNLKEVQICESRKPHLYSGPESPGRIPGAVSIPLAKLVDPDTGTLKCKEDLTKVFQNAGINLTKPIITYCNTGMSATTLLFSAFLCGCPQGSIYHGSFIEWKQRAPADKIDEMYGNNVHSDLVVLSLLQINVSGLIRRDSTISAWKNCFSL